MESSYGNTWVENYLDALLSCGLSTEYQRQPGPSDKSAKVDADRTAYAKYYVHQLLQLDEDALHNAWVKAVSSRTYGEKDVRLEYLSWRVWHMKRKRQQVQAAADAASLDGTSDPDSRDFSEDELDEIDPGASPRPGLLPGRVGAGDREAAPPSISPGVLPTVPEGKDVTVTAAAESLAKLAARTKRSRVRFDEIPPEQDVPPVDPLTIQRVNGLYIVLISLHGLVRGERMELGRDPDTGGQVKYAVELARAMSLLPGVFRVELMTRQVCDPKIDESYGVPEERIADGEGPMGGAFIVRLPCGPKEKYLRKEALWPYVREFADRALAHIRSTLTALRDWGAPCELYAVHGHYADAGEVASLVASTLEADMLMTGHSLGRNKLEHIRSTGTMTRTEMEDTYAISRRIEAEERSLDSACVVFTSTQEEVERQWGLYDGYDALPGGLSLALRCRPQPGRAMPLMKVIPPGLDFSALKVELPDDPVLKQLKALKAASLGMTPVSSMLQLPGSATATPKGTPLMTPKTPQEQPPPLELEGGLSAVTSPTAEGGQEDMHAFFRGGVARAEDPAIWQEAARFLRNPRKPVVLAMSRPDPKKNLTTLVKAFGETPMLRELANLVLVMGNRDNIDAMAAGSSKVLTQVLKLVDLHDLYGSVAYPKHHSQSEISDIYHLAAATRGVFTNIALQEPFGLTVIEAAAHGVPTVATQNGGPVDIMATLHHGVTVDPTDSQAVAAKLLEILTDPDMWDRMSKNGQKNIMAYSWPSHCLNVLGTVETEKRRIALQKRQQFTHSGSWDAESIQLAGARTGPSSATGPGLAPPDVFSSMSSSGVMPSFASVPVGAALDIPRGASMPVGGGDMLGLPPGSMDSTGGMGSLLKTVSNVSVMSNDDSSVLEPTTPLGMVSGSSRPRVLGKAKLVAVQVDGDFLGAASAQSLQEAVDSAREAGRSDKVGFGIVSMLGFDASSDLMRDCGIELKDLDFMVCNSGADIWHQLSDGRWEADRQYESHIDFRWDRQQLSRWLSKWTAKAPLSGSTKRMMLGGQNGDSFRSTGAPDAPPTPFKDLCYSMPEEEKKGVHPHHITLELDTGARTRLLQSFHAMSSKRLDVASGASRKSLDASAAQLSSAFASLPPTAVVDRLKRRLRKLGFRVHTTLQVVPKGTSWLSVLHITPLRASRPLGLRYMVHRTGLIMADVAVVALPRKQQMEDCGGAALSAYTSDFPDLVAGWQRVFAISPVSGRLGYGMSRSLSTDYGDASKTISEADIKDTELAPIEKLAAQLSPSDLASRVSLVKDASRVMMDWGQPDADGAH